MAEWTGLKSLGIAILTSLASELCKDCGEGGLASKTELFGKCTIISLAAPIIKDIVEIAKEISGI